VRWGAKSSCGEHRASHGVGGVAQQHRDRHRSGATRDPGDRRGDGDGHVERDIADEPSMVRLMPTSITTAPGRKPGASRGLDANRRVVCVVALEIAGAEIRSISYIVNPDKLTHRSAGYAARLRSSR
jgi:hypothetical protein